MRRAAWIVVGMMAVASCTTTRYVTVPEVHTDTLYQVRMQRDSIYVHDSTYLHEYTRNDTVFRDKVKWKTAWRDRWHTDTVYRSRVDSIPYPVEVIKEVDAPLPWYTKMFVFIGQGILLVLAGAVIMWFVKMKFKI